MCMCSVFVCKETQPNLLSGQREAPDKTKVYSMGTQTHRLRHTLIWDLELSHTAA